jgi:hypothetical protein
MINISSETNEIFELIKQYGPIRSVDIVKKLNLSAKTVYKHLNRLLDDDLIIKMGETPVVFYAAQTGVVSDLTEFDKDDWLINENYLYVSPSGEMLRGISGFQEWCAKNHLDFKKEKKIFVAKFISMQKLKRNGLVSAKRSILSGDKKLYLDDIFFSDFYNIAHFGKTKLGQLVYLGKSSQNKTLIAEIVKIVRPQIMNIIKKYEIKFICFIPPTIDRKVQFVDVLKRGLKLGLSEVVAIKVPSQTKVPQKTLRKLEDRIINANKTIAVNPNQNIDANILIIDDATGSGATLNETAGKIRNITEGKIKIIGYSVVGSYKGFDVISEV